MIRPPLRLSCALNIRSPIPPTSPTANATPSNTLTRFIRRLLSKADEYYHRSFCAAQLDIVRVSIGAIRIGAVTHLMEERFAPVAKELGLSKMNSVRGSAEDMRQRSSDFYCFSERSRYLDLRR